MASDAFKFLMSVLLISHASVPASAINRHNIVTRYNPTRNASSLTTPMQVGNGNFAYGADMTGMQTFQPFAILTSWGWKNDSLPDGKTIEDVEEYHGVSWDNHGRLVEYDFGGADAEIEQWLTANPNRMNLARIGLVFLNDGDELLVNEENLTSTNQELDLWTGIITSNLTFEGELVSVTTASSSDDSIVAFRISSRLLASGNLGVFIDFPWNDGASKFSAPFVGSYNDTSNHTTNLISPKQIVHLTDGTTTYTSFDGDMFNITRQSPTLHRYILLPTDKVAIFKLSVAFNSAEKVQTASPDAVVTSSVNGWKLYWENSGFVDVFTGSSDERADELQRRIILSRYLTRVNEAGDTPPQESGLVNNGWYGKFHMEMFFWHSAHWALWNNWDILDKSSSIYSRFLPSSIARSQIQQGWPSGARWPKMTDPSGRSSPGEINNLLIWQQPHPLIFAEYEYRAFPSSDTLKKWEDVIQETADWMAIFAWYNESTKVYDLGPPMFVVSEDTSPNITINPAFELAYWRKGLATAEDWMIKMGKTVPIEWISVKDNLAPLPIDDGTYKVYEGLESNFWTDPAYTNDHPALTGLYGWLPATPGLDIEIAKATAEKVWANWNITDCWGWDFPMLAMSAARNNEPEKAVEWLLHPLFQFDDVGMPVGGVRVPTPYFPGAGGLLYTIAFMAAGWDGSTGNAPGFPQDGWNVRVEGVSMAL